MDAEWRGPLFVAALFGTPLLVRATEGIGTAPSMLVGYAWLAGVVALTVRSGRLKPGWDRRTPDLTDLWLGAAGGGLLFVLGGIGYAVSEALGLSTGPPVAGATAGNGGAVLLLGAFGVAAVAEEVAFRGVLQRWLVDRTAPWLAVSIQAAIFAAWHLQAGQLLSAFLYGLVLGALTDRRKSLWPAVMAHLVLNAAGAALFLSGVNG